MKLAILYTKIGTLVHSTRMDESKSLTLSLKSNSETNDGKVVWLKVHDLKG